MQQIFYSSICQLFIAVVQYILVVLTHTPGYKTEDGDDVRAEIRPPASICRRSSGGGHGADHRDDDQWGRRSLANSEDEQRRRTGTLLSTSTHYSDGSDAATAQDAASPPPAEKSVARAWDQRAGRHACTWNRTEWKSIGGGAPWSARSRAELICSWWGILQVLQSREISIHLYYQ